MNRLIEIEWRKLVPSRDAWVAVLGYALLLPTLFLSLQQFKITMPSSRVAFNLSELPHVWHNVAYIARWPDFILYLLALQVITQEYQFRTLRQNIIDGLTPWQYLLAKVEVMAAIALASTLWVGALALTAGLMLSDSHESLGFGAAAGFLGLHALQVFAYLNLAMLFGTLLRRAGMSILAFGSYTLLAEGLILKRLLPRELGGFLPCAALDRLVPSPFAGYVGMGAPADVSLAVIVVSVAYLAAFALVSGWSIAKTDL